MRSESASNSAHPFSGLLEVWDALQSDPREDGAAAAMGLADGMRSVFGDLATCSEIGSGAMTARIDMFRSDRLELHRIVARGCRVDVAPRFDLFPHVVLVWVIGGDARSGSFKREQAMLPGAIVALRSWERIRIDVPGSLDALTVHLPLAWLLEQIPRRENAQWISSSQGYLPPEFLFHPVLTSAFEAVLKNVPAPVHTEAAEAILREAVNQSFTALTGLGSQPVVTRLNRIGRIYLHIAANLTSEDLSPVEVAKALKISTRTLHQTCADHGTTYSHILMTVRLQDAANMLKMTDLRISEIAYAVGYGSLPHFCRQFKETYGMSARAYRVSI